MPFREETYGSSGITGFIGFIVLAMRGIDKSFETSVYSRGKTPLYNMRDDSDSMLNGQRVMQARDLLDSREYK